MAGGHVSEVFGAATLSASEGERYDARYAVDLGLHGWWSAGAGAPQWIEVDLEADATVGAVRLPIGSVAPEGPFRIRVYGRGTGTGGVDELLHEFSGDLSHDTVLEHVLTTPRSGIRFVRFEVAEMNGWVIVHEIEVRAP